MKSKKITIWIVLLTAAFLGLTNGILVKGVVNNSDPTGFLESADCNSIVGWAYDPDTPKQSISVQVLKDGISIGEWSTDVLREDINNSLGIKGNHGFNIVTPVALKDGQSHSVSVRALNNAAGGGGNDVIIGGGGRSVQCGGSGGSGGGTAAWPPPEGTPDSTIQVTADKYSCFDLLRREDGRTWTGICGASWSGTRLSGTYKINVYLQNGVPPSSVTPSDWAFVSPGSTLTFIIKWEGTGGSTNSPPIGKLGLPDCAEIFGWAFDPDTSSNSITVELYKDGQAGSGGIRVGSWVTDVFRGDVNSTYNISGNHGYQFPTPESLKDGFSHTLYMYGIDTSGGRNALLEGSPQTLICGGKNTGTITIRSYENNGQGIRANYVITRPDGSSFRDSISGDFSFREQPIGTWNVQGQTLVNYKYPPLVSPGNSQTLKKNDTITFNFTWEPEPKPPTAEITCNGSSSTTVSYGDPANIRWSSTNSNSCSVSPDGWTGLSGNKTVNNITSFKSYRVTCTQ